MGAYLGLRPATAGPGVVHSTEQVVGVSGADDASSADGDLVWTVLLDETQGTANADAILGRPDGRVVAIEPGGTVALARRRFAFLQRRLDGPTGDPSSYTIFARAPARKSRGYALT